MSSSLFFFTLLTYGLSLVFQFITLDSASACGVPQNHVCLEKNPLPHVIKYVAICCWSEITMILIFWIMDTFYVSYIMVFLYSHCPNGCFWCCF